MTYPNLPSLKLDLPLPAAIPVRPLDALIAWSAEAFVAIHGQPWIHQHTTEQSIALAEGLIADCAAQASSLRSAMEPTPSADVSRAIAALISSWPNASNGDLAGYGAQLVQDVLERKPCRYAIQEGFRHLRQTSRFLPAIAEVLNAIDEAQTKIRNASSRIAKLPQMIEQAKIGLARRVERDASAAIADAAAVARRAAEGKSSSW